MNTLISINNYYYPRGSAETVFLQHNDVLEAQGWRVAPFCMRHEKNMPTPWSGGFVDCVDYGKESPLTARMLQGIKGVYSSWEAKTRIRECLSTRGTERAARPAPLVIMGRRRCLRFAG